MGLDMFFTIRVNDTDNDLLKCMNGGFPLAIRSKGKQIGYFRKAYSIHDYLMELLEVNHEDINCEPLQLDDIHLKAIRGEIEFRFDSDYFIDDWDKEDWEELKDLMDKIKELQKDPNVEFFYTAWY